MFNPYTVILGLFVIGGLFVTLWGLLIILKAHKSNQWPSVDGVVEESKPSSEERDLLPYIQFKYSVGEVTYRRTMEFSGDITPTEEFAASYVQKYPVGTNVQVYYNPANPGVATLEPGLAKGDWLVLAIGLGTFSMGILFFFFGA
jgi:hypothetical protein